jgi:hypothetical protein
MTEEKLRAELAALRASTSWRVTAPLRFVGGVARSLNVRKIYPEGFIRGVLHRIINNQFLRRCGARVLESFPRARRFVLVRAQGLVLNDGGGSIKDMEAELSLPARKVLTELRRKVRRRTS